MTVMLKRTLLMPSMLFARSTFSSSISSRPRFLSKFFGTLMTTSILASSSFFEGGFRAAADSLVNPQGKADAADGLDDALGLDVFELAPQVAHIDIDHVVVAEVVLTPDVLDQLGAA